MEIINNLRIKPKMILSFSLVIMLMAAMSIFAVVEIKMIEETYETVINHPLSGQKAMIEYQSAFRDLRRIVATLSTYIGSDQEKCESLYNDAVATYNDTYRHIDKYDHVVNTHPHYTEADKKSRISQSSEIRKVALQYYNEFMLPVREAALAGDHEMALSILETSGPIAASIREKVSAILESAESVVQTQVEGAANKAGNTVLVLIIVAVAATILAVIIALAIAGNVSKPLAALTAYMNLAGEDGEITISKEEQEQFDRFGKAKDEIGQCIASTYRFIKHITIISTELESIAGGDLTHNVELLSEKDGMGISLKKMIDNLNNMFAEINHATIQVTSGSKQIADGSQVLAQGSTEQSAAVEELSSAISEVARKTKENADMAIKAATLAETIKKNAEKGNNQMSHMMEAVKDINMASQSISKVIKVIDDIAFQTNILALNAAVEAARAGQHGKGFAVVAEEVRNLAAKSAEAAKDTGGLIANSIDKAELGARIADETAASLVEIVTGINESTEIVAEIARSSGEQSSGISQINNGVQQVAQVIQQNSATAEESASASEEMSGQAIILGELMEQFKLRDDKRNQHIALPNTDRIAPKRLATPEINIPASGNSDYGKY